MKANPETALLPKYFKTIAYVIAGLSVVIGLMSYFDELNLDENIFIPLGKYLFLLAIFFFTFSREKNERKYLNALRYKYLTSAIIFAVGYFIRFNNGVIVFC